MPRVRTCRDSNGVTLWFISANLLPTFSISSQFVTMPCSIGYFRVRIPRLLWASSPTYESFWPIPTMTPWWRGRPTIDGKTARGASSPAKPALHIPDPLSTTKAAMSSSAILSFFWRRKLRKSLLLSFQKITTTLRNKWSNRPTWATLLPYIVIGMALYGNKFYHPWLTASLSKLVALIFLMAYFTVEKGSGNESFCRAL